VTQYGKGCTEIVLLKCSHTQKTHNKPACSKQETNKHLEYKQWKEVGDLEERFLKGEQEMKVKLTLDKQCFVLVVLSEQLAFESLTCACMYFRKM